MKTFLVILLLGITGLEFSSQQKEFEGVITYKVNTVSRKPGFDDRDWKNLMGAGDNLVVHIKQGNYLRQSGIVTEYYKPKEEKVFIKFNGIDTLFYRDYSSDTSVILSVSKTNESKKIAGYDCKSIVIKTATGTNQYFYAPMLYANPAYDKNNKIDRFDVFINETSSIWLSEVSDYEAFSIESVCTNIEQKPVDESIFKLPDLPVVKYDPELLITPPEFNRSGGWIKYLQTNLKSDVGAKYVKIPKGEKQVIVTVIVQFTVSRTGEVTDIKALNKKDVHPKLTEEAIRVIAESGRWKPATFLNVKIPQVFKQPISFAVSKE